MPQPEPDNKGRQHDREPYGRGPEGLLSLLLEDENFFQLHPDASEPLTRALEELLRPIQEHPSPHALDDISQTQRRLYYVKKYYIERKTFREIAEELGFSQQDKISQQTKVGVAELRGRIVSGFDPKVGVSEEALHNLREAIKVHADKSRLAGVIKIADKARQVVETQQATLAPDSPEAILESYKDTVFMKPEYVEILHTLQQAHISYPGIKSMVLAGENLKQRIKRVGLEKARRIQDLVKEEEENRQESNIRRSGPNDQTPPAPDSQS